MADRTIEVRADIEQTRARISGSIAELERKANVAETVRQHPWAALAVAFGVGFVLSRSPADGKAAQSTVAATRLTGGKVGSVLDQVTRAAIGGLVGALYSRVDDMVSNVVTSARRGRTLKSGAAADHASESPFRAD